MEPTPTSTPIAPAKKKSRLGLALILLIIVAVVVIFFMKRGQGSVPHISAEALATAPYTTASSTFSIRFPEGWKVDDGSKFGAVVFAINTSQDVDGSAQFSANMNVTSEQVNTATLDEYMKATKEALPKFLSDYKELDDTVVEVGGLSARVIEGTFIQGELKLHNMQLVVIKDGFAYVVTSTSLAKVWKSYKDVFKASTMTLGFK